MIGRTNLLRLTLYSAAMIALGLFATDLLAQDPAVGGAAAPPADDPAEKNMTLMQLLYSGGVMMIPIALCSILAVSVAIERFISLRRDRVIPVDFVTGLRDELRRNSDNTTAGIAYCDRNRSTIGEIFKAGLIAAVAPPPLEVMTGSSLTPVTVTLIAWVSTPPLPSPSRSVTS